MTKKNIKIIPIEKKQEQENDNEEDEYVELKNDDEIEEVPLSSKTLKTTNTKCPICNKVMRYTTFRDTHRYKCKEKQKIKKGDLVPADELLKELEDEEINPIKENTSKVEKDFGEFRKIEPIKEEPVKEPVKEEPVKEPVKEEPVKEKPKQEQMRERIKFRAKSLFSQAI